MRERERVGGVSRWVREREREREWVLSGRVWVAEVSFPAEPSSQLSSIVLNRHLFFGLVPLLFAQEGYTTHNTVRSSRHKTQQLGRTSLLDCVHLRLHVESFSPSVTSYGSGCELQPGFGQEDLRPLPQYRAPDKPRVNPCSGVPLR